MRIKIATLFVIVHFLWINVDAGFLVAEVSTTKDPYSLFLEAIRNGNIDYVIKSITRKHGTPLTTEELNSGLRLAAFNGKEQIVNLLVNHEVDVNGKSSYSGETPLDNAVAAGRNEIAEYLIQSDADVNVVDKNYHTPLHTAALYGREDMIDILLRHGARIDAIDKSQNTPLHIAVVIGNVKVVESLIRGGANVNAINDKNETPLIRADKNDNTKIVDILINSGAKVNKKK